MNKTEFIKQLRATADVLEPFTVSPFPLGLRWNGTEYAKKSGAEAKFDAYALAWFSVLTAIAELIDAQEAPLSKGQIAYLSRELFGGMGSLNDLSFTSATLGDVARKVNDRLVERRSLLYASFNAKQQMGVWYADGTRKRQALSNESWLFGERQTLDFSATQS